MVVRPEAMTPTLWETEWTGVILSPGPGHPMQTWTFANQEPSNFPSNLVDTVGYFVQKRIPILGICLGHQAIGLWSGMQLKKDAIPVHGKIFQVEHSSSNLFEGLPNGFDIVRYHSLALDNKLLPSQILVDAICTERNGQETIMAISHQEFPLWGLQFHPEAAFTQYGLYLLNNWIPVSKGKIKSDLPVRPAIASY